MDTLNDSGVFGKYSERLKTQLLPDEPILKVITSNSKMREDVKVEIEDANSCKDCMCFPFCLISSIFVTPCGACFCYWDNGKRRLDLEMQRTAGVVTRRGLYVIQDPLSKKEATALKWWGMFPKVYEDLMYGGITHISWEQLHYETDSHEGYCGGASKHLMKLWSEENPDDSFVLCCDDVTEEGKLFQHHIENVPTPEVKT